MKTSSDKLNKLIKSLSASEKRYFKLFTQIHVIKSNNQYAALFDVIEKDPELSDSQILKSNTSFNPKQLSNLKNYLYKLILRSLRVFHSETDVEYELGEMLNNIRILFQKGLYDQCREIVLKAKVLAVKYELQHILIQILFWEFPLMRSEVYEGKNKKDIAKLYDDITNSWAKFQNTLDFFKLNAEFFSIHLKSGFSRNKRQLSEEKKIISLRFSKTKKPETYHAIFDYYSCLTPYYISNGEYEKAYLNNSSLIKIMETYTHQIIENPNKYIAALYNQIVSLYYVKKFSEVMPTIEKMRSISTTNEDALSKIFYHSHIQESSYYFEICAFEKANKWAESIKNKISKPTTNSLKRFYFLLLTSMFYVYFINRKYKTANGLLHQMISDPEFEQLAPDTYCVFRVVSLIVSYEMGKQEMIEYTVKSVYRMLLKKKRLFKTELFLLEFIRKKSLSIQSHKDLITSFLVAKNQLLAITKNPQEKRLMNYFDFISWLESKIQNIHFADVLIEQKTSLT